MKRELNPVFEIVSERFVKPSISTPPFLRFYKLSYNDQTAIQSYVPLAFFYPNPNLNQAPLDSPFITRSTSENEKSHILEITLSKTLSYYYPFAGRLRDNLFIECNDMGIRFIEIRIKCEMIALQNQPNSPLKGFVFPSSLSAHHDQNDGLLIVQLSYFDCGGMAISLCMSHKVGDASTLSAFVRDWAAMANQSDYIPSPQFVGASLFPPLEDPSSIKKLSVSISDVPVTKLLFPAPKIALLKEMVAKSGVKNPTRVEVVSSFLYRCAMVSARAISGSFRPALLVHALNLRPIAALPMDSVGNFVTQFAIVTTKEEEMTLPELVSQLRNAKVKIQNEYKEKLKGNGSPSQLQANEEDSMNHTSNNKELNIYSCSSWCRFPFYDIEFGWGKPLFLGMPNMGAKLNQFILMDTRNEDSIEAIVKLKNDTHMSALETNEQLLAFASLIA